MAPKLAESRTRVGVTATPVLTLPSPQRGRVRFDSAAEALMYDELVRRQEMLLRYRTVGIAVHPLVRVLGHVFTPDSPRTHAGHAIAVQVDGVHHGRRYDAARSGDEILEDCGARVQRATVEDITDPALLETRVDRVLTRLLGAEWRTGATAA